MSDHLLLHLSLISGIGPATVKRILSNISESARADCYELRQSDWIDRFGFSAAIAAKLVAGLSDRTLLDRELQLAQKYAIDIVDWFHPSYPLLLKEIHCPPVVLYTKGAPLRADQKALAVVGSRKANQYAHKVISSLVPDFITHNWTIVSGGALGADTMAHQVTVDNQGATVVILGSGLLRPYPAANKLLFQQILKSGGTLVSSFSLETSAAPGNFPARNRIIAGMSSGCVVVQAAARSGAQITAECALEQGREVFAVPGSIFDPISAGCHELIKQGALLVTGSHQILRELGEVVHLEQPHQQPEQHSIFSNPLVALCQSPISFDDLLGATDLGYNELQSALFDLQIEGKIMQNYMGFWQQV